MKLGVTVLVNVGVPVLVLVNVAVGSTGVCVRVNVGVPVRVRVNVGVGVPVRVNVGVPVRVLVNVGVDVLVLVKVAVVAAPACRSLTSSICMSMAPFPLLAHWRAATAFCVNGAVAPKPLCPIPLNNTVTFVQSTGAVNTTP